MRFRRSRHEGEKGFLLMRKLTITPMDEDVAHMIDVTKKKTQITKFVGGLGDAALMYLD